MIRIVHQCMITYMIEMNRVYVMYLITVDEGEVIRVVHNWARINRHLIVIELV